MLAPHDRVRANLASVGCALAGFLVIGTAMWSQLLIGWQWSRPATATTTAAILAMSGLMLLFTGLVVLAALPVVWAVITRRARGVTGSVTLTLGAVIVTVVGTRHFAAMWPGTGGHAWAHQHVVPGGVAAFAWATTLSISSYWAHPTALLGFPTLELVWMASSPVAVTCLVAGVARTVRRLELSARVLRFEAVLARVACACMLTFVAAPCSWIVLGGSGPRNLFHVGAIDLAGVGLMLGALAICRHATRQARDGLALLGH